MEYDVKDILHENKLRWQRLNGNGNQLTGEGIPGHDFHVILPDYPIHEQWLNEDTAKHPLYKHVIVNKSITACANQETTTDDIIMALTYIRCQNDPWFAFIMYFRIRHKMSGKIVPFQLNHAQHKLLSLLEQDRLNKTPSRVILLKARQWGGSTLIQLYMAWMQLFKCKGWNSVIVAQTKDTARRIKAMYRTVLNEMPADLFGTSKLTFAPKEGSVADSFIADSEGNDIRECTLSIASFENFESVRGAAFAMAHYSEVAYWDDTPNKNVAQVITNIDGGIALQPNTLEVMESSANGMSGYFYDEYQKAKYGNSAYKALFIPFFEIEHDSIAFPNKQAKREFAGQLLQNKDNKASENDTAESGKYLFELWKKGATLEHISWYVKKRKGFHSHDQIASEAPSDDRECFIYSGTVVFSPTAITEAERKFVANPVWKGDISSSDKKPDLGTLSHAPGGGGPVGATPTDGSRPTEGGDAADIGKRLLVEYEGGPLLIWRHPDHSPMHNQYIITVDVGGRGERADYSVMTVIDRAPTMLGKPLEVVARWRGHLRYDLMAWKAVNLARYYGDALLVYESNTFDLRHALDRTADDGDHIRSILYEIDGAYNNLYYRRGTTEEDIEKGAVKKIGFVTNRKTKQDMIDHFTVLLEDGGFADPDARTYKELAIYQMFPDGHFGNIPGQGNHDDILMSDMIAALVCRDLDAPGIEATEVRTTPTGETINESYF